MKLILQILLILLLISTLFICSVKPKMHKSVLVYDSAYKITETSPENSSANTKQVQTEQIATYNQSSVKQIKSAQEKVYQNNTVSTKKIENTVKPKTTKITNEKISQTQQTPISPKTITKSENVKTETITTPKTLKTETINKSQPKILTEKEEEIAWNVWRSNLQNKIMQDTRLPLMPNGVVFRFSFTVDKYGKVSDVQTWSDVSTYTPYAIQYIAPVIKSYQGKSILEFPQGSSRTVTNVKGGWRISSNEKFSTPSDFNDIERIKK